MALGGSNSGSQLTSYCDRYEGLLKEKETLLTAQKAGFKELAKYDLPVNGIKTIMADSRRDKEKLELKRKSLREAGAVLGVTVYVGEVSEKDETFGDDVKSFATTKIEELVTLQGEIDGLVADMKEVLEEAEGDGFVKKLIPQVVKIRRDPNAFKESSMLLNTYLDAVGVSL